MAKKTGKVKVGVIGCGVISGIYFERMCKKFTNLDVVACADLVKEKADAAAQKYGVKSMTVDELLADPEIEIVVNLTIPIAHASVGLAAIKAGKSVHNEKPFAISREDGKKMLELAMEKGVLTGCAPDTFMGGGIQTCRKLIDDGVIGQPIGATAFMMCHGHESWHPAPEFYYKVGGGPMFDMGPYYLTALVNLIGPVKRVQGSARVTFPTRTITSQPLNGKVITVDVPTHVVGVLDFVNGAVGNIITSFDVWAANLPCIEIYGTKGTLKVPDPNGFGGPVQMALPDGKGWRDVPLTHGYADNNRGIGVADMGKALRSGRPNRASGALAYHVLDIMHAIHDASDEGKAMFLKSIVERPAPMPTGLADGELD